MLPTALTGCLTLILLTGIYLYLEPLEPGVLSLAFAFTPEQFYAVVDSWPARHLQRFINHLLFDVVLIVAYAAFGPLLATLTPFFKGFPGYLKSIMTWLLPVAAIFDLLENTLHWWLINNPSNAQLLHYQMAAYTSLTKQLLLFFYGFLLMIFVIYKAQTIGEETDD